MKKTILFFIGMYTIMIIVGFLLMADSHEKVHVAIYEDYNIESHIEYWGHGFNWVTIAEPYPRRQCTENCQMMHEFNEIIGYHASAFYVLIGTGILIIISILGMILWILYLLLCSKEEDKK